MAFTEGVIIAIMVLFVILSLLYRRFRRAPKPGPNPLDRDCTRPAQPLVLDQATRNSVLKQGFAAKEIPADLDAIVIGSGIGGLTVANILSKVGQRVLVLEQHDKAGGSCHTFIEKGFEFPAGAVALVSGIHYVGSMQENPRNGNLINQLTEGQLTWEQCDDNDTMYVTVESGQTKMHALTLGSYDRWKTSLVAIFPDEERVISEFVNLMKIGAKTYLDLNILKFLPKWVCRLLVKTGLFNKFTDAFKYSSMSTQEVLDGLTGNDALKTLLTYNFCGHGCLPAESSFIYYATIMDTIMNGTCYPRGGSSEIPFHMIPVIERAGGRVLVRARVTEILGEDGRVVGVKVQKGKHGEEIEIRAPLVISDAGVVNTFTRLLPKELANKSSIPKIFGDKVNSGRSFISLFVGLNCTTEELNLQTSDSIVFNTDNVDQDFGDYLNMSLDEAVEIDAPSLFITFTSAKDSTYNMRFPGKSVCVVLTLANWEWFAPWEDCTVKKRGADYAALKNRLKERIWQQTCSLFPQLSDKVGFLDMSTPVTSKHYLNAAKGAFYGLGHTKERFGSPDIIMTLRPETDIPGLLITGQDVMGCGLVANLYSGLMCASKILRRNLFNDNVSLLEQIAKKK